MRLQKLKIITGNDMSPSIDPTELLLLDQDAVPQIGDVILFENRFNLKIAHRLLYRTNHFYFTKGDNCIVLNFPEKQDRIKGVVVGKHRDISLPFHLKLVLRLFVVYFRLTNLHRKQRSLLLKLISYYLVPKNLTIPNATTTETYNNY